MQKTVYAFLFFMLQIVTAIAQDIPLFTQKITNSFLYNPAIAGHTFGSATFAHRSNYAGIPGAPRTNFLSIHTPFANHRFGAGINIFQEEVTFLSNNYLSGAFAYH